MSDEPRNDDIEETGELRALTEARSALEGVEREHGRIFSRLRRWRQRYERLGEGLREDALVLSFAEDGDLEEVEGPIEDRLGHTAQEFVVGFEELVDESTGLAVREAVRTVFGGEVDSVVIAGTFLDSTDEQHALDLIVLPVLDHDDAVTSVEVVARHRRPVPGDGEALHENEDFELFMEATAKRLLGPPSDDAIDESLAGLGDFFDLDRVTVNSYDDDEKVFRSSASWTRGGVEPLEVEASGISISKLPWAYALLTAGEAVEISGDVELPPDAASERALYGDVGVESVVLIPVLHNDSLAGFVSLQSLADDSSWSDSEVLLARRFVVTLSTALARNALAEELNTAIAEAREAKSEAEAATHQVTDLKAAAEEATGQLDDARKLAEDAQSRLAAIEADTETAHTELEEAREASTMSQADVESARSELDVAKAAAAEAGRELEETREEAKLAQRRAEDTAADALQVRGQLEQARSEIDEARRDVDDLRAKLAEVERVVPEAEADTAAVAPSTSDVVPDLDAEDIAPLPPLDAQDPSTVDIPDFVVENNVMPDLDVVLPGDDDVVMPDLDVVLPGDDDVVMPDLGVVLPGDDDVVMPDLGVVLPGDDDVDIATGDETVPEREPEEEAEEDEPEAQEDTDARSYFELAGTVDEADPAEVETDEFPLLIDEIEAVVPDPVTEVDVAAMPTFDPDATIEMPAAGFDPDATLDMAPVDFAPASDTPVEESASGDSDLPRALDLDEILERTQGGAEPEAEASAEEVEETMRLDSEPDGSADTAIAQDLEAARELAKRVAGKDADGSDGADDTPGIDEDHDEAADQHHDDGHGTAAGQDHDEAAVAFDASAGDSVEPPEAPHGSQFPGLDTVAGVNEIAGNVDLYRSLLVKFRLDYNSAPKKIGAAVEKGDIEVAYLLLHAIKGVAGVLGASEIRDHAETLESALMAQDTASIQQALTRFSAALTVVIQSIDRIEAGEDLSAGPAPGEVEARVSDPKVLRTYLAGLRQHLHAEKAKQCQLVIREITARTWPAGLNERVERLAERVRADDFEEARNEFEALLAKLE